MEDSHSLYNELRNNLFRCSIFYLAKFITDQLDKVPEESLSLLGQVLALDSELYLLVVDDSFSIFRKPFFLEENTFKIVQYRTNLHNDDYNLIAEKYVQNIEVLKHLSSELLNNFDNDLPKSKKSLKTMFSIQYDFFSHHLTEVEKITGIKSQRITAEDIVEEFKNNGEFKKPLRRILVEDTIVVTDNQVHLYKNKKVEKESKPKTVKPFRDFIKHPAKIEIEKLVKEHFSDLKGVTLRYLIEYFIKEKILTLDDIQSLYDSIIDLFDGKNIAHKNSIFGKSVFNNRDQKYLNKIVVFNNIFQNVLQTT
jgi:hypothetical protein